MDQNNENKNPEKLNAAREKKTKISDDPLCKNLVKIFRRFYSY